MTRNRVQEGGADKDRKKIHWRDYPTGGVKKKKKKKRKGKAQKLPEQGGKGKTSLIIRMRP